MSANTSSRKSFTQRDYVRSSTDGVGIDLYSRQDTRMYHYSYAWEAFTHICTRTHACCMYMLELERENSRTRYTHGMSWTGIDLAYSIDTSGFSLSHSRSLAIRNFTSGFKTHDAAILRPTMCSALTHPHYFFSSGLRESWIMRQAWDCHAKPVAREEKQASRTGRYFHPNARQSATLVYVLG